MKSNTFKLRLLYFFTFVFLSSTGLRAADIAAGKALFSNNCGSCHAKDMKSKLTGPALGGAEERWGDKKAIYSWIRGSQALIATGQPRAVAIYTEYNKSVMSNFPNLKDGDIENILGYIDATWKEVGVVGPKPPISGGPELKEDNTLFYGVSLLTLAVLALVLGRIISNLNRSAAAKEGINLPAKSWAEMLTSKAVIGFAIFAMVVLGGYTTVNNAISLGRSQGYQPDQPIKFSHAIHAGENKIDCQYCHDGARRSKQSVIPATNTCMNCHKAIKVGSQYGTAELSKIYASVGWDPTTDKYIPNYENLSQEEVAKTYKTWIASKYRETRKIDSTAPVSTDQLAFVEDQWNGIRTSLTNEIKDKVQGPIEWKRLHNLPDHVYFNHAQHVAVGKVACQKCHGEVEKMAVVKQYAPLSMGWCINCHRETSVQFKDNDYYKSYARYHEEFKKGNREKVTVEDIGGLECQKCHY
jgi:mono/diheme cytochrome c family protein